MKRKERNEEIRGYLSQTLGVINKISLPKTEIEKDYIENILWAIDRLNTKINSNERILNSELDMLHRVCLAYHKLNSDVKFVLKQKFM